MISVQCRPVLQSQSISSYFLLVVVWLQLIPSPSHQPMQYVSARPAPLYPCSYLPQHKQLLQNSLSKLFLIIMCTVQCTPVYQNNYQADLWHDTNNNYSSFFAQHQDHCSDHPAHHTISTKSVSHREEPRIRESSSSPQVTSIGLWSPHHPFPPFKYFLHFEVRWEWAEEAGEAQFLVIDCGLCSSKLVLAEQAGAGAAGPGWLPKLKFLCNGKFRKLRWLESHLTASSHTSSSLDWFHLTSL